MTLKTFSQEKFETFWKEYLSFFLSFVIECTVRKIRQFFSTLNFTFRPRVWQFFEWFCPLCKKQRSKKIQESQDSFARTEHKKGMYFYLKRKKIAVQHVFSWNLKKNVVALFQTWKEWWEESNTTLSITYYIMCFIKWWSAQKTSLICCCCCSISCKLLKVHWFFGHCCL